MLLSRAKLRDVLMKFLTLGYMSFVFSAILDASRFITIVELGPPPPVFEKIRGIKEQRDKRIIFNVSLRHFLKKSFQ